MDETSGKEMQALLLSLAKSIYYTITRLIFYDFPPHLLLFPFFQFLFLGNAQQVQLLRLLIYTAAREGAQQFIEMILSTSAGRLVFNAYKDSQPLPEVVARDHGHNETACYLEGVTRRYIIHRIES